MLTKEGIGLPSNMAILPNDQSIVLNRKTIKESLSNNPSFALLSFSDMEQEDSLLFEQSYEAELKYLNESFSIQIYVGNANELNLEDYGFANRIGEKELEQAMSQRYFIEVSLYFGTDNIQSFHLQLKILNAIVPDASVVIDFMSYRLLSAQWLKMAAQTAIPPSPDYLYTLHCIYDEDEEGVRRYWFHTHGLHRCKTVELEMLNITQGVEQMQTLINMTVRKFLSDATLERERFTIGYDGMGINLCWLRWEEALSSFPKKMLGGIDDRKEEGNVHAEPSGILFAVEEKDMISPEIYAQTLAKNPIYYITTEETKRMSALAKERFSLFKKAFELWGVPEAKKNFVQKLFKTSRKYDENEWSFLVKLGLTVDGSETGDDKEHLWFEVKLIEGDKIVGKLLNQPYWIAGLKDGDEKTYTTESLTDWIIYAPDNTYTTDTIYQLEINEI